MSKPRSLFLSLSALLLPAAVIASQVTVDVPKEAERAAQEITAKAIEAPVRVLADDLFEGRAPASRGDALTRLYLANEMREIGLQPGAADGGWEQPFDIVGITSNVPEQWTFGSGNRATTLKWSDEFIAASGLQETKAAITDSELVFVGYGIEAPEYQWDDFKGADLRGKTLVMLNNDPDWDPELFDGKTRLYYGRWSYKYESAARQGAAGAIIIHTNPSAGYGWNVVQSSWTGEQFELPAGDEPRAQVEAWVTEDAARKLLASAGHDLDQLVASARSRSFRPVPLGVKTSLAMENEISRKRTANVLGLLPGSDPDLAREVVVYTAHHDHLGVGEAADGSDVIYNGARDNAVGVAQVLAIARAFRELPAPPRRSILFLFVAAEEQGLLGSKYYAQNPTFHPGRIAANINFDGGNIWGRTRDVTLIGYGRSSLDAVAEALAARQGRVVKGDQFPDKGFYYRSDQFAFAQIGVPALYFDDGTEFHDHDAEWGRSRIAEWERERYHQPADEIDETWSFEGLIEDARLGFFSGVVIANSSAFPRWHSGDEFEAARKAAVTQLQATAAGAAK